MKKNLFWSLFAATALLTACNDDSIVSQPDGNQLAGAEAPVSFSVAIGNPIGTYATTSSELGGWSNFKNDATALQEKNWFPRAILKVYQGDNKKPIAEQTIKVENAASGENKIDFTNVRLQAGATYTALVWVDFVSVAGSEVTSPATKFYNISDEGEVTMEGTAGENIDMTAYSAELRDAYTNHITFTLNADGKYTPTTETAAEEETNAEPTTTIPMTAKRVLSKLRIVMTDFEGKDAWKGYFTEDKNKGRILDYVALNMKTLATKYDARTGVTSAAPTTATTDAATATNFQFHHPYANTGMDVASASWNLGDIKWVDKDGKSEGATDAGTAVYPVLDFNYFFSNEAGYAMDIKLFAMGKKDDGSVNYAAGALAATDETVEPATTDQTWKCISFRSLSSIPAKQNCLTTIQGKFLTQSLSFNVTVEDEFDNRLSDNVVNVDEDGTTVQTVEVTGTGGAEDVATLEITKDAKDRNVTAINVTGVTATNQNKVLEELSNPGNHGENIELTINGTINGFDNTTSSLQFKKVTFNIAYTENLLTMKVSNNIPEAIINMVEPIVKSGQQYQSITFTDDTKVILESGHYKDVIVVGTTLDIKEGVRFKAGSTNSVTTEEQKPTDCGHLSTNATSISLAYPASQTMDVNGTDGIFPAKSILESTYPITGTTPTILNNQPHVTITITGSTSCKPYLIKAAENVNISINGGSWGETPTWHVETTPSAE